MSFHKPCVFFCVFLYCYNKLNSLLVWFEGSFIFQVLFGKFFFLGTGGEGDKFLGGRLIQNYWYNDK